MKLDHKITGLDLLSILLTVGLVLLKVSGVINISLLTAFMPIIIWTSFQMVCVIIAILLWIGGKL